MQFIFKLDDLINYGIYNYEFGFILAQAFSDLFDFPDNISEISWKLLPFVSGTRNSVKKNDITQHTPKIKNVGPIPTASATALKYLVTKNDKAQQKAVAIGAATVFTSIGNSSDITAHGSGPRPQQYVMMNKTRERTGKKPILSVTGCPLSESTKNIPNRPRPTAVPQDEISSRSLRPSLSTMKGVRADAPN